MNTAAQQRYTPTLRRLHWLVAALVLAGYLLIEQRGLFPRGSDGRAAMVQGHFWAGIMVFALVLWRLARRRLDGVPAITPPLGRPIAFASGLFHVALYAFLVVMPLIGLATAWSDGKSVMIPLTGIALPALLPENEALAHTLEDLHGSIGEAFYWVIGAHVLAALWHHLVRRDDTLRRML